MSSYTGLGGGDEVGRADTFPALHIEWRELLYFRSFQAAGLARILYYFSWVAAIVLWILDIIIETRALNAGGFFLGFFGGLIQAFFIIVGARIALELALSVFNLRENVGALAAARVSGAVPQPPPRAPSAPGYQGYEDVKPQAPSVFEPQYQSGGGYQSTV